MSVQKPTLDEVFLALTGQGIPDEDPRPAHENPDATSDVAEGVRA